jgi:hypothetical protein
MRALVISDTHFGAWTGEDLLREQANLDLLEPHLEVDEVIVLGDMFDFELLFTIAQVPNGTNAERRVYKVFGALGHAVRLGGAPRRALEAVARWGREGLGAVGSGIDQRIAEREATTYESARSREAERRRLTGAPAGGEASSFVFARRTHPDDPTEAAVAAFDQVVTNLGWVARANEIVFAHTHQPLDGVLGLSGKCRYWNTGSWIYEPDLDSQSAYIAYFHNAWPGTAVLIDTDENQPQLLRLREHLNPLNAMAARPA